MMKDGPIKRAHLQRLGDALLAHFTNVRMEYLGISYEQLKLLQTPVVTKVTSTDLAGEELTDESSAISFSEYWFVYGILFFVLMATVLTGTQVATSIVTEKSNRVVEYLLISVKPLALMIGKVLAMMTAALIQMISMVAALLYQIWFRLCIQLIITACFPGCCLMTCLLILTLLIFFLFNISLSGLIVLRCVGRCYRSHCQ